ncbi:hypothetical protein CLOM_g24445 [Closterium sp. NIES-68]|nr:hypothetical protein CLOM_g24445 [Closterium sp. NIES-68]GJP58108.1 hypothetical protein CLOP_g20468 [Closterium sp. NIES-67]GJP67860.1 hypothetical protein CLOP_g24624 [Closterium sp. NIES-67]
MAGQVCVVTGGRGFVGRWLVRKLLATGEWATVRVVDMAPELKLTDDEANGEGEAGLVRDSARSGQLEYISGNVCDRTAMVKVFQGASAVFHMASPNHALTDLAPHYTVNVLGIKNVIAACQEAGVRRLVFTSSASVVFDGRHDIKNGDESLPYAGKATNAYGETKAQAEAIALAANGQGGLLTCALRPSNIFGPGDPDLVPITVRNAQKGKLKFIVGDGENMSDWTYVENVVHAHICAEKALSEYKGDPASEDSPAGKAYFVTNADPRRFWDFIFAIAGGFGYSSKPIAKLPADVLIPIAAGVEAVSNALAPFGVPPSDFTPARLLIATRWRTFSPARAGRLLGYKPIVTVDEGLERTIAAYPHLQRAAYEKERAAEAAAARAAFRKRSAVHKALGGGVVADLLLWQDARMSVLAMLLAWMVLRWAIGRVGGTPVLSLAASAAMAFLLLAAVLHRVAPVAKRFRLPLPDVAAVEWRIPEKPVVEAGQWVAATWNGSVAALQEKLLNERDWGTAGKVLGVLTVLQLFSSFINIHTLSFLALLAVFAIPSVLDKRLGSKAALSSSQANQASSPSGAVTS